MDDRVSRLADDVEQLTRTVAAMQRRIAALEAALAMAGRALPDAMDDVPEMVVRRPAPVAAAREPVESAASESWFQSEMALAGRTLVALGGAYLLRALTEAGVLPVPVGIAAGLLYAAVWLVAAARARGPASAIFHTLAATLMTLPILWEASLRFRIMDPPTGAVMLGVFAAAGLVVAAGRRLEAAAWIIAGAAALMAVALGVATRGFLSYTVLLTVLGIATLWLGYLYDWLFLRWPVAALGAAMLAGVTYRGATGHEPMAVFLLQILFFSSYLGSFALRTLFLGRAVIPFEVAQSICVIVVGFGGAVYLTAATGANIGTLGLLAVAFGIAAYGVAFAFVEGRRPPRNFFFYAALGLTFVLVGAPLAAGRAAASIAFAALGVASALGSRSFSRLTLSLHCKAYLVAAAIASGLLSTATIALLGDPAEAWPVIDGAQVVAFGAIVAAAALPARHGPAAPDLLHRLPRFTLLLLVTWTAAGAFIAAIAPSAVPQAGSGLDAAPLAALRTTVLVVAALLLARARHDERFATGSWLVYPLLGAVALKLLFEDLPTGRPNTLFVALGVYGLALIVSPRLMRQR